MVKFQACASNFLAVRSTDEVDSRVGVVVDLVVSCAIMQVGSVGLLMMSRQGARGDPTSACATLCASEL